MTKRLFPLPQIFTLTAAVILTACGSSNSPPPAPTNIAAPPPPPPPPPPSGNTEVTLSGTVMFERVPLNPSTNGLNYNSSFQEPIRQATVQLLDSTGAVISNTTSNNDGFYSFSVASDAVVSVNVRAEIIQENLNFQVIDNTSNNAIYTLQGSEASVGTAAQTRNLVAASGWTGTSYTQARAAAPFALLDTLLGSAEMFSQTDPNLNFPAFDVLWSVNNRSESGNVAQGEIGSSSFTVRGGRPQIRILGDANQDTDEYDEHVVTHEFGHYIENQISRADSLGGPHSLRSRLDPRVAFSEGWGNALSAILTGETTYRDSGGQAQASGFSFDIENQNISNRGWYSEASVQAILYDIFDSNSDGPDQISAGLAPLLSTFTSLNYIQSEFASTIYNYIDVFASENPSIDPTALTALLESEQIFGTGPDGAGETNNGGLSTNLPVYRMLELGAAPLTLCSVNDNGLFNRLGNRLFMTLDLPSDSVLNVRMERESGPSNRDPDFRIFNQGRLVGSGLSPEVNLETGSFSLNAGRYIISAADDRNLRLNDPSETGADSCYLFSVNGG